ncbi:MAG: hypothetical protein KAT76_00700 [Bacteroidales bacterium]|nr:hypothetical protein [Bacteroidales bacterium]
MIIKKKIADKIKNLFLTTWAAKRISYRTGSRMIKYFTGTPYARQKYFKKKVRAFKTFLKDSEISDGGVQMLSEMLEKSFIKQWRLASFSYLSDKKFTKYVQISNLETLVESHNKGKGVILLNSHFGYGEMSISIIPRIGFQDFYTIIGTRGADTPKFTAINPDIKAKTLVFSNLSTAELFKVLMEARQVLNNGGIIHLLGDGYQGKSGITFPFIGKLRTFRESYAELALSTDAEIIPIFIYPKKNNFIQVDLYPVLDKGNDEMSRKKRINSIIKQYVDLLSEKWMESPQLINPGHIEAYLNHVDKEIKIN